MFHTTQHEDPAAPVADPQADPAAAAAQAPAADPASPPAGESLIVDPAASKPAVERIPDKYQVKKEDGTLDPDASWAKFVDGHEALQKKHGAGDRKSTRLNSVTNAHLVCRLLLEQKKNKLT